MDGVLKMRGLKPWFAVVIFFYSCCIFSQSKEDICNERVLGFFDSLVYHSFPLDNISSSYEEFCRYLMNSKDNYDFIGRLTEKGNEIDSFIQSFDSIEASLCFWIKPLNQYDKLELNVNNYSLLLNDVVVYLPFLNSYKESFCIHEELMPSYHYGLLNIYEQLNFDNKVIRLFFATHYITIIYNFYRYGGVGNASD